MWASVLALVLAGLSVFVLAVALDNVHAGGSRQFARAGYCSVAGDLTGDGSAMAPGTFLDLIVGEPVNDWHYTGAVPANFVEGIGLVCGGPPVGYVRHGFAADAQHIGTGIYPYYVRASG
jgi:hypothetical protein